MAGDAQLKDEPDYEARTMISVQRKDDEGRDVMTSARWGCAAGTVNVLADNNPHLLPSEFVGDYCALANTQAYALDVDSLYSGQFMPATDRLYADVAGVAAGNHIQGLSNRVALSEETRNEIAKAALDGVYLSDGRDTFENPLGGRAVLLTGLAATAGYDDAMKTTEMFETGYENASVEELGAILQQCYTQTTQDTEECYRANREVGVRDKSVVTAAR